MKFFYQSHKNIKQNKIMNITKIFAFSAIATLPFLASCTTWNNWYNSKYKATWLDTVVQRGQSGKELVMRWVKEGRVSCFSDWGWWGSDRTSLFEYACGQHDEGLLLFCLRHPDSEGDEMHAQVLKFLLSTDSYWVTQSTVDAICSSGILSADDIDCVNETRSLQLLRLARESGTAGSAFPLLVKNWIRLGADVNAVDEAGNSILVLAIKNGWNPDCVEILLQNGARCSSKEATEIFFAWFRNAFFGEDLSSWEKALSPENCEKVLGRSVETSAPLEKPAPAVEIRSVNLTPEILAALVRFGVDLSIVNENGETLLFYSWKQDRDGDAFKLLSAAGAQFSEKEEETVSRVLYQEKIELLAKSLSKEVQRATPNADRIRDLISEGANVNKQIDGHSPLYFVFLKNPDCAEVLVSAGAKLLPEEKKQMAATLKKEFTKAIADSDIESVKRCIVGGVDVNEPIVGKGEKEGQTCSPLFLVELLRTMNEVNRSAALKQGTTDMERAYLLNTLGYSHRPGEIAKLLKNAGAKMSEEEERYIRKTRLQALIVGGIWEEIAAGVKNGSLDLKEPLFDGENGFHALALCNFDIDESVIAALKKAGANINKKNDEKKSPLAIAIENSNVRAVSALLRHGANPNDNVPVKGAFGEAGEMPLMRLALEQYNNLIARKRNGKEVEWEEIKKANEVVSLMAKATGTEITDL